MYVPSCIQRKIYVGMWRARRTRRFCWVINPLVADDSALISPAVRIGACNALGTEKIIEKSSRIVYHSVADSGGCLSSWIWIGWVLNLFAICAFVRVVCDFVFYVRLCGYSKTVLISLLHNSIECLFSQENQSQSDWTILKFEKLFDML